MEKKEVAVFQCQVEANPFDEATIHWALPDHPDGPPGWDNKKEIRVNLENKTSTLSIHFATRRDSGRVVCQASNGVKNVVATKETELIVDRKNPRFQC